MNFIKIPYKTLFFIIILLCSCIDSSATYYVDLNQPNDDGDGTSIITAKKYIESGLALLAPGDTLIIRDGNYSDSKDNINQNVPSGDEFQYTTIKAENYGGVIINNKFSLSHSNHHIIIDGLHFKGSVSKNIKGQYIKIFRTSFQGSAPGGNSVIVTIGTGDFNDTQYILLEDCWVFGLGGRYSIMAYNADRVILRRCVVRNDGGWTSGNSDPEASIAIYQTSNALLQNCIVIDSDLETYDDNNVGAFYLTGHLGNRSSHNVIYQGCIALNVQKSGWNCDTDDLGTGTKLIDCIAYDIGSSGVATSNNLLDIFINQMTIGNVNNHGMCNYTRKGIFTAKSSIIFNAGKNATKYINNFSYTNTYMNGYEGNGTGVIHVNPLDNGLKYLVRVEDGSTLNSAGESGSYMGAKILNRIGISGTLYGEVGYDSVTNEQLWPWPNENRIKADFRTVSKRGFCADGKQLNSVDDITLTSYIWEYLGNPMP